MKKVTLIATVALATATIALGAKVNADETSDITGLTSKTLSVTASEGTADFAFLTDGTPANFDFSKIDFGQDSTAKPLTSDITLPSATLSNHSFTEKKVQIDVTASGTGLTLGESTPVVLDAKQAEQKKSPESTVTVSLDPTKYDSAKSGDYKVTISATEVTDQNPEG